MGWLWMCLLVGGCSGGKAPSAGTTESESTTDTETSSTTDSRPIDHLGEQALMRLITPLRQRVTTAQRRPPW